MPVVSQYSECGSRVPFKSSLKSTWTLTTVVANILLIFLSNFNYLCNIAANGVVARWVFNIRILARGILDSIALVARLFQKSLFYSPDSDSNSNFDIKNFSLY